MNYQDLTFGEKGIYNMVSFVGLGFHPDNDFHDYVDGDMNQSFDQIEADWLNLCLAEFIADFELRGECVYDFALKCMNEKYPSLFKEGV